MKWYDRLLARVGLVRMAVLRRGVATSLAKVEQAYAEFKPVFGDDEKATDSSSSSG